MIRVSSTASIPQCKGVHRVHQPLSDKPLPYRELAYTGVEYVEPHLLPCTVCQRPPSASYQTCMFQLEQEMQKEFEVWRERANNKVGWQEAFNPMLTDFHPIRHHILGTQIAACQFHICQGRWLYNITVHGGYPVAEELPFLRQLMQLVSQLDTHVLRVPNEHSMTLLGSITETLVLMKLYEEALPYCRRTVRMFLILHGRECRDCLTDEWLKGILCKAQHGQQAPALNTCAFCDESPACAAMKLSRCAGCKCVAYCSKGCQKAHWPVHRQHCKTG
jgi:hypothetical protein